MSFLIISMGLCLKVDERSHSMVLTKPRKESRLNPTTFSNKNWQIWVCSLHFNIVSMYEIPGAIKIFQNNNKLLLKNRKLLIRY